MRVREINGHRILWYPSRNRNSNCEENMESSSSSSDSPPPPRFAGRPVKKTFVFLTHKVNCVPRRGQLAKLVAAGRVREMTIWPSFSRHQMVDMIKSNIPAAADLDPNRLVVYINNHILPNLKFYWPYSIG